MGVLDQVDRLIGIGSQIRIFNRRDRLGDVQVDLRLREKIEFAGLQVRVRERDLLVYKGRDEDGGHKS